MSKGNKIGWRVVLQTKDKYNNIKSNVYAGFVGATKYIESVENRGNLVKVILMEKVEE